jgi:hypothetical protein
MTFVITKKKKKTLLEEARETIAAKLGKRPPAYSRFPKGNVTEPFIEKAEGSVERHGAYGFF